MVEELREAIARATASAELLLSCADEVRASNEALALRLEAAAEDAPQFGGRLNPFLLQQAIDALEAAQ